MPRKYALALIVITIIFFGGIFLLVRLISGGGDDQSGSPTSTVQKANDLSDNGTKVTYTVYGKLVGEEDRRAIRITVNDNERLLEVLQGYDESVLSSERFPNKTSAFDNFLLALENAGFTTRDTAIKTDDRAVCPLGNRYVFEAQYQDNSNVRSWSTSCSIKQVSFKGDRSTIDTMFKAQIPDYSEKTRSVTL
jgi:hypothetical protein